MTEAIALFEKIVLARGGQWIAIGLVAVAALSLGMAFTAEHVFYLEPCILCLYQRVPFAVAGVAGLAALIAPGFRWQLVTLAGIAFLTGSVIAAYHVGVEQHWWASATGCGVEGREAMTFADMKKSLTQKELKSCDEVDWTLFGISMATYNVVYSAGLGAITLWAGHILRLSTQEKP